MKELAHPHLFSLPLPPTFTWLEAQSCRMRFQLRNWMGEVKLLNELLRLNSSWYLFIWEGNKESSFHAFVPNVAFNFNFVHLIFSVYISSSFFPFLILCWARRIVAHLLVAQFPFRVYLSLLRRLPSNHQLISVHVCDGAFSFLLFFFPPLFSLACWLVFLASQTYPSFVSLFSFLSRKQESLLLEDILCLQPHLYFTAFEMAVVHLSIIIF